MKNVWLSMMREKFNYNNETYTILDVLSIKNMDFVIYQDSSFQYAYLKRNEIEERMTYSSFDTLVKILPQYQSIGMQNIKNMLDAFVSVLNVKGNLMSLKKMFWEVLERDQEYLEPTATEILSFEYFEMLFQTESYSYFGKNANKVYHLDASILKEEEIIEEKKTFFTVPRLLYATLVIFLLISMNGFLGSFGKDNKKLSDYLLLNTDFIARLESKQEAMKKVDKNYWLDINLSTIDVDFNTLKKNNPNIIGWFFVNNTGLNYPIVQEKEDSKSQNGWLLADNSSDFVNFKNNTFLYTNDKLDIFAADIKKQMLNESWYSKEENQLIVLSTPLQNTVWKVVAVTVTKESKDDLVKKYQNIDNITEKSIYDFKETVTSDDKTLTLIIPLNSNDGNIVICAKMVHSRKSNN